ncbi:MAG: YbaL family putative K(+) efflux transporter [Alphaproteobacteria bacterium]
MPHHSPLLATIVIGIVLAFILGAIANRFRISPLVGYILAGVIVGPHTPGFVADQKLALELAEIGVILLMFGVGLHFSPKDLLAVKTIAIPGAVVQIGIATLLGLGLALLIGWDVPAGIVFGLALSVASTVVLLRALEERRILETKRGQIAVGWLIVEDLAMVLALVLLPAYAAFTADAGGGDQGSLWLALAITIGKVTAFVAIMMIVGRRVIPWLLHQIAYTGSRELFRLAVLAIALGVAFGAAMLFDVSFALGAFFAGMMLSESELSHEAAAETLPLRDAFAVLFFVSIGMLFSPRILIDDALAVLATVFIILIGKSAAAYAIVKAFKHPTRTALVISASLAQIGEFSFILAGIGVALDLMPERGRDLVLAGALISILLNPLFFVLIDKLLPKLQPADNVAAPEAPAAAEAEEDAPQATGLYDHSVVIGAGRVGGLVIQALRDRGLPFLVVEENGERVAKLRELGVEAITGNAVKDETRTLANMTGARRIFVAIPNAFEAGQVVEKLRAANPNLEILARSHSDEETERLRQLGASHVVMAESEVARAMVSIAQI